MFFGNAWTTHHPLCGSTGGCDPFIGGRPVFRGSAEINLMKIKARDLSIVDLAQPGSGKPHFELAGPNLAFDQADLREKTWAMRRTDIGPVGHAPPGRLFRPVVEQLPLLGDDELCPERPLRHIPRHGGRPPSANRLSRTILPIYESAPPQPQGRMRHKVLEIGRIATATDTHLRRGRWPSPI